MISKLAIKQSITEASRTWLLIPGLVDIICQYALPTATGNFKHLELLNKFMEYMPHEIFQHETCGYWLTRIDGTCDTAPVWSRRIRDCNEWLCGNWLCESAFYLVNRGYRMHFPARHNLDDFMTCLTLEKSIYCPEMTALCEGDRLQESREYVSVDSWWPLLEVRGA
jgi:hypothetical protein